MTTYSDDWVVTFTDPKTNESWNVNFYEQQYAEASAFDAESKGYLAEVKHK